MYKKIIFSLILVFSLFITKDVFALEYTSPYKIDSYNGYQHFVIKSPINATGWLDSMLYSAVYDIDENSSLYGYRLSSSAVFSLNEEDLTYSVNEDLKILPKITDSFYSNSAFGNKIRVFMCNARFVSGQGVLCYDDDFNIESELALNYLNTTDYYYFDLNINTGSQPSLNDISSPVLPLVSGIDKVSLYTLNNEDLSTITTPIPFDAGHSILFFNYEEDSYRYLAFNMTICHNGQLEGCTVSNETYVEDYFDISSLGFSSSGDSPLSFKINFKDVVSQSDLINMTWFLTNCPSTLSSCPDGVSDGRGYTYLINNSLSSDSWLTFDDSARPECSIARLDVCLINAVNYFIKPRTSGFANSFSVAHTRINERIPFVYLYAVRDSFTEIFNSPTASVNWSVSFGSLGSLTVLDSDSFSGSPYYSFFTGMRVYLSYLLWILLGVGLYKRAVRLFDDKTVA